MVTLEDSVREVEERLECFEGFFDSKGLGLGQKEEKGEYRY